MRMKKYNTSPISGMQELSPIMQAEFDHLKDGIAAVFARHGFLHIETPTIERSEILLAKAGGDTEKQIYKVIKTAEAADGSGQALRFDHTVPLARYVVEHMNDLCFPFKVTQIGRNFRGERAQRGRFREFYQCDVDILGRNTLDIAYDAEIIATLAEAIRLLPLPEFVVRISNRKLLSGMLAELNLQQHAGAIFNIVDHAEKVPAEVSKSALEELGIGSENVVKITTFIGLNGEGFEIARALRAFGFRNEEFNEGVRELEMVFEALAQIAPQTAAKADMLIVRGLDYYTGTVFETIAPQYKEIGSICSGGRYENLASNYTEQKLPGVGGSIGLTRLFFILREYNLIKTSNQNPVDVCLIPFSSAEYAQTAKLADSLREVGKTVDLVLSEKKLGDKMKYASRVAKKVAVIGENEITEKAYRLRDLATGDEQIVQFDFD